MDSLFGLALIAAAVLGWQRTGVAVCFGLAAIGIAILWYTRARTSIVSLDLSAHRGIARWIITNYLIQLVFFAVLYGVGYLLSSVFG